MDNFYIESYNSADETINFGTRSLASCDNLYEAITLCCLRSSNEETQTAPDIQCVRHDDKVLLSLGNVLHIFGDSTCSDCIFQVDLDSAIDAVTVNEKYVLVCLRDGQICLLDIEPLAIVCTSKLAETASNNEERYFINCFSESYIPNTSTTFLLVDKQGAVKRLYFENDSAEMKCSHDTVVDLQRPINKASYSKKMLLLNGEVVTICDPILGEPFDCGRLELSTVQSYNENQFIGLTIDGKSVLICANTGMIHDVPTDFKFTNIIFYNEGQHQYCFGMRKDDDGKHHLCLKTFSDMSQVYSLNVKCKCILMLVPSENAHDEQMFISMVDDQEYRIQMVTETSPQTRLERLLRRHKFDEAEKFARTFKLDIEPIMKAKVGVLTNKDLDSEEVDVFIGILDKISDMNFKLEWCSNIVCNSVEDIRRVFSYGLSLDLKKHQCTEDISSHINTFRELNYKFETYTLLSRLARPNAICWYKFANCDVFEYLIEELSRRNIKESLILFSRLSIKRIKLLSDTEIETILSIFDRLPLDSIVLFMHTFLPITLLYKPSTLPIIIRWICSMVFRIEKNDYASFPENAIDFLDTTKNILNVDMLSTASFLQYCQSSRAVLDELDMIVKSLHTIRTLKKDFKVFVPLKESLEGPASLVKALLLVENISIDEKLMGFLIRFLLDNQIDPDNFFSGMIKELMLYDETCWIAVAQPIWTAINATETKLNCLKAILKGARLPWCPTIHAMLKQALEQRHPLVADIELEIAREPIYIIIDKYKLNSDEEMAMLTDDDDVFAVNRIIYCNEPTLVEDVFTMCVTDGKKKKAALCLLLNLKDDLKASNLLKKLSPEEVVSCLDQMITGGFQMSLIEWDTEYYIQIMDMAINRIKPTVDSSVTKSYEDFSMNLKAVLLLRKQLNYKTSITDLTRAKDVIVQDIVRVIVQDFQDNMRSIEETMQLCSSLSTVLRIDVGQTLLKICDDASDSSLMCYVARYLYEQSSDVRLMGKMVTVIMKSIGKSEMESPNGTLDDDSILLPEKSNTDIELYGKHFGYAKQLMAKILLHRPTYVETELFKWMSAFGSVFSLKGGLFSEEIYTSTVSEHGLDLLRTTFIEFTKLIEYKSNLVPKHPSSLNCLNVANKLEMARQKLYDDGNHLAPHHLLIWLRNSLTDTKIEGSLEKRFSQSTNLLLQKVCNVQSTSTDQVLVFSLLSSYPYEKSMKFLQQWLILAKYDLVKVQLIAELSIELSNYHNIPENKQMFLGIIMLVKWWKFIDKCVVPYREFFRIPRAQLLEKLIISHFDVKDIQKFCEDFHLDPETYYIVYLKKLLTHWSPEYEVTVDLRGVRCLKMKSDEITLYEKCMEIVKRLRNRETVFEHVNGVTPLVNVYHYEVFICILRIVSKFHTSKEVTQKKLLLSFLKNYTRTSKPSESEIEEWFTKLPDTQAIEPLSEWRLPFTPTLFTHDVWNILKLELNLTNYNWWFTTLHVLQNLNKDDICSYVVKQVSRDVLHNAEKSNWVLQAQHTNLLAEFEICIKNIKNLERATSVAYYLVTLFPPGADQVNAAKMCYRFAKLYLDSPHDSKDEPDVNRAFVKVQTKFYAYSAMHILHLNNLADDKYLSLVGRPDELIEALYSDERIVRKESSIFSSCPDINHAVDELADLFELNIFERRVQFLEQWLSSGYVHNETMNETLCLKQVLETSSSDTELLGQQRSAYICKSGDLDRWQKHLLASGMMEDTVMPRCRYQAKALRCLCAITPAKKIEEMVSQTYEEFLYYIDKLFILDDLQCLGFDVNLDTLHKCPTKDFLRKLVKNSSNASTLKTMGSICMTYSILEMKYWQLIIGNAIQLKLYDQLKVYLHFLIAKSENPINDKFFVDGWQYIIDCSFRELLNYSGSEYDSACIEHVRQIQTCPVLDYLNLEQACLKYLELKRSDLAALLVQYLPKEKQAALIDKILVTVSTETLLSNIENLYLKGLSGTDYVIHLITDGALKN